MKNSTLSTIRLEVDYPAKGVVPHAGIVLPARVAETSVLVEGLPQALAPWRAPTAVFHPGHMLTQLALAVAAGGDHPVDIRELAGANTSIPRALARHDLLPVDHPRRRCRPCRNQSCSRRHLEHGSMCETERSVGRRCGHRKR